MYNITKIKNGTLVGLASMAMLLNGCATQRVYNSEPNMLHKSSLSKVDFYGTPKIKGVTYLFDTTGNNETDIEIHNRLLYDSDDNLISLEVYKNGILKNKFNDDSLNKILKEDNLESYIYRNSLEKTQNRD